MQYLTAGESHGAGLTAILEGFPSNVPLSDADINAQLKRRQQGYGRGGRMKIESDAVHILSGMLGGKTIGSPIALFIENRDFAKWKEYTHPVHGNPAPKALTAVRPGHADRTGCVKYDFADARMVLERASARETAARVAVGAVCRRLLEMLGIRIASHVTNIGGAKSDMHPLTAADVNEQADKSAVRTLCARAEKEMIAAIDSAMQTGDTVGGEVELLIDGVPAGVGSYVHYDRKLDAVLAGHLMSVQAVKSVSFGLGEHAACVRGSQMHDQMYPLPSGGIERRTNRAGGIEGGMSNGETIVSRIVVKPIPTLMQGLQTVDIATMQAVTAHPERSDYCAVPAAGVVAENVAAFAVLNELLKVTGGDDFHTVARRVAEMRQRAVK